MVAHAGDEKREKTHILFGIITAVIKGNPQTLAITECLRNVYVCQCLTLLGFPFTNAGLLFGEGNNLSKTVPRRFYLVTINGSSRNMKGGVFCG